MWQVQITRAMRRCIWPEASPDPVERAVSRHIKATAATRELSRSLCVDLIPRRLCIGRSCDPARSYSRRKFWRGRIHEQKEPQTRNNVATE